MKLVGHIATAAEFKALAEAYQAGLEKCVASGYEEFGPEFQRERKMVVAALLAASALRALAELPPKDDPAIVLTTNLLPDVNSASGFRVANPLQRS
jgi:hypothetical protein